MGVGFALPGGIGIGLAPPNGIWLRLLSPCGIGFSRGLPVLDALGVAYRVEGVFTAGGAGGDGGDHDGAGGGAHKRVLEYLWGGRVRG
jgi:hypothetical protein